MTAAGLTGSIGLDEVQIKAVLWKNPGVCEFAFFFFLFKKSFTKQLNKHLLHDGCSNDIFYKDLRHCEMG